ncbi:MAG: baseplate J/gp47 family protein [Oscillospiraceae bacterium]|nr:baseplate J/gp47 family protein [Oscillospiraceae bacterium]
MFEEKTFESILDTMLEGAANQFPELDIREGSLIYSALAPAAVELTKLYLALHTVLEMSFADTASREFLIRRSAERGIFPLEATHAVIEAVFTPDDVQVPPGTRFRGGAVVYVISGVSGAGYPLLTAETAGRVGNLSGGNLVPVRTVDGLRTAVVRALVVPGQDVESTQSLRQRYLESYRTQAFGGNIADYREKVLAIPGVGGVRVFPAHRGPGTVGIGILGADFAPPSEMLIATVQEVLDPLEEPGSGRGLAPIGHQVKVMRAEGFPIVVATTLTLQNGVNPDVVYAAVYEAVEAYLLTLRSGWGDRELLTVRLSQVDTRLLDVVGVLDVSGTSLNGQTGNLLLDEMQVPILGALTLL